MKIINFCQEDSNSINFDNTETQLPSGICGRDLYIKSAIFSVIADCSLTELIHY